MVDRERWVLRRRILAMVVLVPVVSPALHNSAAAQVTRRVSVDSAGEEANGESRIPFPAALSANGRRVVFHSEADDLVPGDTNGVRDVFMHDRMTGETRRVSVSSAGGEANDHSFDTAISQDGTLVAFSSDATNLVAGDTVACHNFAHHWCFGVTADEIFSL